MLRPLRMVEFMKLFFHLKDSRPVQISPDSEEGDIAFLHANECDRLTEE